MSAQPGRRWESTRYKVGDTVRYQGFRWSIVRIDMMRGVDKHPRPFYALERSYPKPGGKGRTIARGWTTASELKMVPA